MVRTGNAIGLLAVTMVALAGTPATAEVLDATYRGTLVCEKLPFTKMKMREAIHVIIAGGKASYTHVVRLKTVAVEPTLEKGDGTVTNQSISLQGAWSQGKLEYKAAYSGSFVRRTAWLKGTQTWTEGGKTISRACAGAIKRPFKAFLPRRKKASP
jgi:hypothetical protein